MLRQREVIGTVVNGDGDPISNGTVKFKTTIPLAYTSSHVIVDEPFSVQTDSNGSFSITLWCDEDSLVEVNYNVYFPVQDGNNESEGHTASFSLTFGDGTPISISELILAGSPAPSPEDPLYEYVNQAIADGQKWTHVSIEDAGTITPLAEHTRTLYSFTQDGDAYIDLDGVIDPIPMVTRYAARIGASGVTGHILGTTIYAATSGNASIYATHIFNSGRGAYVEILFIGGGAWQVVSQVGTWHDFDE